MAAHASPPDDRSRRRMRTVITSFVLRKCLFPTFRTPASSLSVLKGSTSGLIPRTLATSCANQISLAGIRRGMKGASSWGATGLGSLFACVALWRRPALERGRCLVAVSPIGESQCKTPCHWPGAVTHGGKRQGVNSMSLSVCHGRKATLDRQRRKEFAIVTNTPRYVSGMSQGCAQDAPSRLWIFLRGFPDSQVRGWKWSDLRVEIMPLRL